MSAEVLANDLDFDLYVIDLSTVVDKYIGETEKNLDRIFTEADRVNGVLLFDEADARCSGSAARSRTLATATRRSRSPTCSSGWSRSTALRSRRRTCGRTSTRRSPVGSTRSSTSRCPRRTTGSGCGRRTCRRRSYEDDLDPAFLARQFRVSGGNVKNIGVTAAYLAAADGRRVSMSDLIRGTDREYRKLGRLTVEAEFGKYFDIVAI